MATPSGNCKYSDQAYWDHRYTSEEQYDWFSSVYPASVEAVFEAVEKVYAEQRLERERDPGGPQDLKVLHLGAGNSSLCKDLHRLYMERYPGPFAPPYRLVQIAVDYSAVVIENMWRKYAAALPHTYWEVADVRDLAEVRQRYGSPFDVVVDKGTMDALQTDSDNPSMEEDIQQMLKEASACLVKGDGKPDRYRQLVQITWEIPYCRLHYTVPVNSSNAFAWGSNVSFCYLGDSDIYRIYTYEVQHKE